MDKPPSLLKHPDFMKFWTGQTISVFGSQFSAIAVPFAALYILNATPFEFGVLATLSTLAFLLFSLNVGVYVDRHRRRIIMIYADIGRAMLLAIIPLSWYFGYLTINLLYVVTFLSGLLTVFFEISYQSYVPALVDRNQLVDANGKLETSRAVSSGAGPSIAGAVVNAVSPPIAVIGDTLGYLGSASFLISIKKAEAEIEKTSRSTWHDVREGLSVVFNERKLWQTAGCTATANLFSGAIFAIIIPYLNKTFNYDPFTQGVIFSISAVGSILGAQTASRIAAKIGVGRTIVLAAFLFGAPTFGLYFATGYLAFLEISSAFFIAGIGSVVYNVNQVSFRQALVPRALQGRMNASMRFIVTGAVPIGGFLGGVLAEAYGYRGAIGLCTVGVSLAFLWVLFSPIRGVKEMPTTPD